MDKKEVYEMLGVRSGVVAKSSADGSVELEGWGCVVLRADAEGIEHTYLVEFAGQTGYYDDDEWEPDFPESWDALSEEEREEEGEEAGETYAIVYFGAPLLDAYHLIPYSWLRPATAAEALAYNMQNFSKTDLSS